MKTSLIAGLDENGAEEVRAEFRHSGRLRERLIGVLNDKKASYRSEILSKTSYEKASWPDFQADAIGFERAIDEVISLLMSKKDEI